LACCEWLEWGGKLLFSELQDEVVRKEQEVAEAKAWAEAEAVEVKRLEEEEEARQAAAAAKKMLLNARKAVLVKARKTVLAGFHMKTLSKDDLQ
jgi:hypothetical protein